VPLRTINKESVTIRDIDIPMSRLVAIIFKLMIASIPAMIAFYAAMFLLTVMLAGGLGALGGLART